MRRYVLRRTEAGRNPSNNNPTSPPSNNTIIRTYVTYMECERNMAERIGGRAYDGCREFLATGAEGTPAALICAACQCNRSFHRAVVHTEVVINNGDNNAPPPPPSRGGGATA